MMNFPSKRGAEEPQNPENHMVNRPYGTMKGSPTPQAIEVWVSDGGTLVLFGCE